MKTINYSKKVVLVTVAVLGVASFATGAYAGDSAGAADSRVVSYADLNVNSPAGAKVLYQRIRRAADLVCGDVSSQRLAKAAAHKACVDQAVVASVQAVNKAELNRTANAHGDAVEVTVNLAATR